MNRWFTASELPLANGPGETPLRAEMTGSATMQRDDQAHKPSHDKTTDPAQAPLTRQQKAKWLRLHLADQVGSKTFAKLLKYFGTIDEVLNAPTGHLVSVPGIGRKTAEAIVRTRDNADVESELSLAEQLGIDILTLHCPTYPKLLLQIPDPPPILYVKGELTRRDSLAVALVGSRNASHYGQEQASRLAHLLAAAGFTVVSGLARGIDAAAHRGALAAEGRTIAVQGCGLGNIYPPEHNELADQIVRQGALVSELPIRFEPLASTFPMRNRIIAGLSLGTIVVEARPRSGALITARLAVEQDRDVMAVPGRVDSPGSAGPHLLIKEGAKLVERIEDVLECLGQVGQILDEHAQQTTANAQNKNEPSLFDAAALPLTEPEQAILAQLDHEPVHVDQLVTRTNLPASAVNATVMSLQLKGAIKQLPGNYFKRR